MKPALCTFAGHEIGHMVNMLDDSTSHTSIMGLHIDNYQNPPNQYEQSDIDRFMVKIPSP